MRNIIPLIYHPFIECIGDLNSGCCYETQKDLSRSFLILL